MEQELHAVTMKDLRRMLETFWELRSTQYGAPALVVEGPPGIGKSEAMLSFMVDKKCHGRIFHPLFREPVDLTGVPSVVASKIKSVAMDDLGPTDMMGTPAMAFGRTVWNAPSWLPKKEDVDGVFDIEELGACEPTMQKACARILYERMIGDHPLPKSWIVVATTNSAAHKAGSFRLLTHLCSRVVRVNLVVDAIEWLQWGSATGRIHRKVRGYIAFKSSELHGFDPDKPGQYPCPRSWELLSRALDPLPNHLLPAYAAGCVGAGAASGFVAFCELEDKLPKAETIIAAPLKTSVPTEPSVLCAVGEMLAEHCRDKGEKVLSAAMAYLGRIKSGEYSLLAGRALYFANPTVINMKEFSPWLSQLAKLTQ